MNQNQIALLRQIAKTNAFDALEAAVGEMVANWSMQTGTGATEFEYLKSCLIRDGKIEGVKSLLKTIEDTAYEVNK